jgi:hypothetical protein
MVHKIFLAVHPQSFIWFANVTLRNKKIGFDDYHPFLFKPLTEYGFDNVQEPG